MKYFCNMYRDTDERIRKRLSLYVINADEEKRIETGRMRESWKQLADYLGLLGDDSVFFIFVGTILTGYMDHKIKRVRAFRECACL